MCKEIKWEGHVVHTCQCPSLSTSRHGLPRSTVRNPRVPSFLPTNSLVGCLTAIWKAVPACVSSPLRIIQSTQSINYLNNSISLLQKKGKKKTFKSFTGYWGLKPNTIQKNGRQAILRVMPHGQHVVPNATVGRVRPWQHRVPPYCVRASRHRKAWREVLFFSEAYQAVVTALAVK